MGRNVGRLIAALVGIAASAAYAAPAAREGAVAPPFDAKTVAGDAIDLASLRGQVVVINRWATWCVPCRAEFALFDGYTRLRGQYGLTIVAIESGGALSSGPMTKLAHAVQFPVVLEHRAHANSYPTINDAVPTNYVIDRSGVVRYAKAGAFTLAELDEVIRPLLNEHPQSLTAAANP